MGRAKPEPRIEDAPHSEEVERAVLACFLLEPGCLDHVPLREEHFHLLPHRNIFRTMASLRADGVDVDMRTIQAQMELHECFEESGGLSYLSGLDLDLPDFNRIETYTDILEERLLRRRMIQFANAVQKIAKDGSKTSSEGLVDVQEKFLHLRDEAVEDSGLRSIGDFGEEVVEEIIHAERGHVRGISTGIKPLDDLLGGMLPGQLIVVAARPGRGKTTLATNIAQHVSMVEKREVAMFSFEMSGKEVVTRVLSSETSIPKEKMVRGYASQEEKKFLRERYEERVRHAKFRIDDGEHVRLDKICSTARKLKANEKLDFLVVDQAQLVQTRVESRNQEVSLVARTMKSLARELGIPILLVSHMNRDIEKRGDNAEPTLADLAESGDLEKSADIVIFIHYDDYRATRSAFVVECWLIVAKDRDGREGRIPVVMQRETSTFRAEAR